MPEHSDESSVDVDTIVELLWLSEHFNLPPGTKINNLDHLAKLIEEHLSQNGQSVNVSEKPFWHNELESDATEILDDPQYAFPVIFPNRS